jgi:hypothetical protein
VSLQGYQYQADLADMSRYARDNDGYKFLLCIIDCFSRFAWVIPLKNKSGPTAAAAFETIFEEHAPKRLQSDEGTEFFNKDVKKVLQEYGITLFATNSEAKASIVERFIRTFKSIISHLWVSRNTFKYIDKLPELVDSYNNRSHRSIGMAPAEVTPENSADVYNRLYPTEEYEEPKFKIDDFVRTTNEKATFGKESTYENWTKEIFKIAEVLPTTPTTYKLVDLNDKPIKRAYYEKQLQKVKPPPDDVYQIEKVIKYRTRKGKREAFVKWLGYDDSFNQWIDADEIQDSEEE